MSEQMLVAESERESGNVREVAVSSWLVGFHGAVQASHLGIDESLSLRDIALSHKSLGIQPLSVLTDLPSSRSARVAPRAGNGLRPVGRVAGSLNSSDNLAEPAATEEPAPIAVRVPGRHEDVGGGRRQARRRSATDGNLARDEPWDEKEPLSSYLDRRLLEARVLYLPNRGRLYHLAKRTIDIVGALILLIVMSPVILALAVLIRLDSPGPALFHHERVTLGGRLFTFYKFRTMWVDARERFPELYDYTRTGEFGEVYYKLEDDPRNTRVGRWLRRTTLDELPNLINVLKGDMTLVGPRPELPQLISYYRPEDLALFFTKAGVTGLAQVAGRSLLTVRERITLDLRYVAQQTLILDIRILARTVLVVLLGKGAF